MTGVRGSVINLTVHGIGLPVRPLAPGEDRTWVSVEQLEQVIDAVVGRDDVRLTFDDGNASDVDIALPRLLERGLSAEFFVPAGLLGEPGWLTADGIRELLRAGMSVGSHGWAHRDWRRVDAREAAQEFDDAHELLSRLTGRPVSRVAIPFGSYDRHVLARLKAKGVTCVYTSDGGRSRPNWWLQPRNSLRKDVNPEWTTRLLIGDPSLRDRALGFARRSVKRTRGRPSDLDGRVGLARRR